MRLILFFLLFSNIATAQIRSYVIHYTTRYPRASEADISALDNGDIIVYYSRFYGGYHDDVGSDIYSVISHDGGKNWVNNAWTQPNIAKVNTMSVSTLNESGTTWLFFLVRNSSTDLRPWLKKTTNNGSTWTTPAPLFPDQAYWTVNNNRIIRTSSGRLICPAARVANGDSLGVTQKLTSSVWYSDNNGSSWTESNRLSLPQYSLGMQEPGVVELSAGNLLMYARVQAGGRQWFANSTDNGTTWGAPYQSTLVSPMAPAKLIKLSDGRLLAAHCNNGNSNNHRRPMTLSVSADNGATWTVKYNLTSDPIRSYAYPSLLEKNGEIYMTYWEQQSALPVFSLVFARIPLTFLN